MSAQITSSETFNELQQLQQAGDPRAALEKLISALRADHDHHRLFDALLLKKKFEMGLPLARPTSLDDVPDERREEFERTYIASAREVGKLLLDDEKIAQAWMYFQAIRDPAPVAEAIEKLPAAHEPDGDLDEVINIAFYQGANPLKGVELMLQLHGTCSTITALDQVFAQMAPEQRSACAARLVRSLHGDLMQTVGQEVTQRMAAAPPAKTLRELTAGREWLFADGNYHIDVSHLHSTVRFARALGPDRNEELRLALDLAEYGAQLDEQFRYPGDPPFDDFYGASIQYFKVLLDEGREQALDWFRQRLERESDDQDRQMIAYVLVDLLSRMDKLDEAIDVARHHLLSIDEQYGFSFAELCQQAGRMDALQEAAREKRDLVAYTAALLQDSQPVSA